MGLSYHLSDKKIVSNNNEKSDCALILKRSLISTRSSEIPSPQLVCDFRLILVRSLFEFGSSTEYNKILFKQPWNFNGVLLIFSRLEGEEHPTNLHLTMVPFWVQIHGLQLRHMTVQIGRMIAKAGEVIDVECALEGVAWGRCFRVRVLIDVTQPLYRGIVVSIGSTKTTVLFQYEKLSDFCYICGMLDHVDKDCQFCLILRCWKTVIVGNLVSG